MKYLNELKRIDTQDKAYVLGLFYSDGHVTLSKKSNGAFCGITLHKNDEYIFDEIIKIFPFFVKNYDKSKSNVCILRCNQRGLYNDLVNNGCLPKKSSVNKDNLKIPDIHIDLIRHFVRGFFDGDGSVYKSITTSKNSKYCTFTGTCKRLLEEIQYSLLEYNINFRLTEVKLSTKDAFIKGRKINISQNVFVLTISNRLEIDLFAKYLYTSANLFLIRKFDKMNYWEATYREFRSPCRACGSFNTSYTNNGESIKCKECKKIIPLFEKAFVKMESKQCKHCESFDTVGNGKTYSRTDKRLLSQIYLCRICNKTSSYNIHDINESAPDNSNVIRVSD